MRASESSVHKFRTINYKKYFYDIFNIYIFWCYLLLHARVPSGEERGRERERERERESWCTHS